jgi:hypothetical protein
MRPRATSPRSEDRYSSERTGLERVWIRNDHVVGRDMRMVDRYNTGTAMLKSSRGNFLLTQLTGVRGSHCSLPRRSGRGRGKGRRSLCRTGALARI